MYLAYANARPKASYTIKKAVVVTDNRPTHPYRYNTHVICITAVNAVQPMHRKINVFTPAY